MIDIVTYHPNSLPQERISREIANLFAVTILHFREPTPDQIANETSDMVRMRLDVAMGGSGVLLGACSSCHDNYSSWYVDRLAVNEKYRGRKIATYLLATLARSLNINDDVTTIKLVTGNDSGRNGFYTGLGFSLSQVEYAGEIGLYEVPVDRLVEATEPVFRRPPELPRSN